MNTNNPLNNYRLSRGDIVICNRSYIETEFANRSYYDLYTNGKEPLVILTQGKKYKIAGLSFNLKDQIYQIQIKNNLGELYWCDANRFNTIKELRKQKLQKLNERS